MWMFHLQLCVQVGHRVDKVILVGDMKTFKMRHLFRPGLNHCCIAAKLVYNVSDIFYDFARRYLMTNTRVNCEALLCSLIAVCLCSGSDLLPKVLGIIESNYPDMLGTCYVLNGMQCNEIDNIRMTECLLRVYFYVNRVRWCM